MFFLFSNRKILLLTNCKVVFWSEVGNEKTSKTREGYEYFFLNIVYVILDTPDAELIHHSKSY